MRFGLVTARHERSQENTQSVGNAICASESQAGFRSRPLGQDKTADTHGSQKITITETIDHGTGHGARSQPMGGYLSAGPTSTQMTARYLFSHAHPTSAFVSEYFIRSPILVSAQD